MQNQAIQSTQPAPTIDFATMSLDELFPDRQVRILFSEREKEHGVYRLYVSRPFGVKAKGEVLPWKLDVTVQFDGDHKESPVNNGTINLPISEFQRLIDQANEMIDEHAKATAHLLVKARRESLKVVSSELDKGTADGKAAH